MRSIKTKILCLVIIALIITATSIGFVSYSITHEIMHENADEILKSVSNEKATGVNAVFRSVENAVHNASVYAESILEDVEQLGDADLLAEYTQNMENYYTNIAEETPGVIGYYFRLAPELTFPTSGFLFYKNATTGKFFRAPMIDFGTQTPSDSEQVNWYHQAINAGKATWLAPYNSSNKIRTISYVTPVYCGGTLIGVLGMDMELDRLLRSIDEIAIYQHGFAYLIGNDEKIIYTKRTEDHLSMTQNGPYTEASAELNNGMTLVVRVGYQDIQKDARGLLHSIIIVELFFLIVFITIAVFISNHIINPLKKLTVMARSLAEGKGDSDFEIASKDEIGTLSQIFKETSEKLQDHISYINALAYRDSLTGVKNTSAYLEAIAEMEKQMNCSRPEFGVLVADINNLKQTNDTLGHDAGNQLIIHASRLLGGTFRYSPLFRIGGDEFVVILTGKDFENYRSLLKHLDDASLQETLNVDGTEFFLSLARGVAIYNPSIDTTFNDVFHHADHAMYMHKQAMKQSRNTTDAEKVLQ